MNADEFSRESRDYGNGLPMFLGRPASEGPEQLPERPWDDLLLIIGHMSDHFKDAELFPDDIQLRHFIKLFYATTEEHWSSNISHFLRDEPFWLPSPSAAWDGFLHYFTSKEQTPRLSAQLMTTANPGPETISSILYRTPAKRPAPQKESKKRFSFKGDPALETFILKHAPSAACWRVYSKVLSHTRNKFSAKGKRVYPYGQAHIARLCKLSQRSVERAWAWLRSQGILNKAWNENRDRHSCSGWYVCTSMKQVAHFRDPEHRHSGRKR